MPRKNRFAPPGYWLHITQRGNDRQRVFLVRVAAYTLMSNHFHLVAIGDQADAVSLFMMDLSGLYATYRNAVHRHTGHLWQGRFYSAVLDSAPLGSG